MLNLLQKGTFFFFTMVFSQSFYAAESVTVESFRPSPASISRLLIEALKVIPDFLLEEQFDVDAIFQKIISNDFTELNLAIEKIFAMPPVRTTDKTLSFIYLKEDLTAALDKLNTAMMNLHKDLVGLEADIRHESSMCRLDDRRSKIRLYYLIYCVMVFPPKSTNIYLVNEIFKTLYPKHKVLTECCIISRSSSPPERSCGGPAAEAGAKSTVVSRCADYRSDLESLKHSPRMITFLQLMKTSIEDLEIDFKLMLENDSSLAEDLPKIDNPKAVLEDYLVTKGLQNLKIAIFQLFEQHFRKLKEIFELAEKNPELTERLAVMLKIQINRAGILLKILMFFENLDMRFNDNAMLKVCIEAYLDISVHVDAKSRIARKALNFFQLLEIKALLPRTFKINPISVNTLLDSLRRSGLIRDDFGATGIAEQQLLKGLFENGLKDRCPICHQDFMEENKKPLPFIVLGCGKPTMHLCCDNCLPDYVATRDKVVTDIDQKSFGKVEFKECSLCRDPLSTQTINNMRLRVFSSIESRGFLNDLISELRLIAELCDIKKAIDNDSNRHSFELLGKKKAALFIAPVFPLFPLSRNLKLIFKNILRYLGSVFVEARRNNECVRVGTDRVILNVKGLGLDTIDWNALQTEMKFLSFKPELNAAIKTLQQDYARVVGFFTYQAFENSVLVPARARRASIRPPEWTKYGFRGYHDDKPTAVERSQQAKLEQEDDKNYQADINRYLETMLVSIEYVVNGFHQICSQVLRVIGG